MSATLFGQSAPNLGTTATYGVFTSAGQVANTGLTQVIGDIGTNAGEFSGFPPGVYTGSKHVADTASLTAKNDLSAAWNELGATPCDSTISTTLGNGQVLMPGTYCLGPSAAMSGTLTLDARGNPNAIFIIKIAGALNTAASSTIVLSNLAQAGNVYWRIDGAVSILDNSTFSGTIISNGAIHLYSGTTLDGRALAVTGAITMASNRITVPATTPAGSLTVLRPATGETVIGGMRNYQIQFVGVNVTQRKTFEFSLDSGATWNFISMVRNDSSSYSWNVPKVKSERALVRITDSNGVSGVSGLFRIDTITTGDGSINSLTLGGVVNNWIDNSSPMTISWTFTPDIGTSVDVQYSLDSGSTWSWIATVPTNDPPSVLWTTPSSGSYSKAFIRVVSTKGMNKTSDAFRIGPIIAGVYDEGSAAGYSITNAPNPVSGSTAINFVVPIRSVVKITVYDALGNDAGSVAWRSFEAGDHSIPFNASELASGVYTYTLQAGKIRISGRMTVVK